MKESVRQKWHLPSQSLVRSKHSNEKEKKENVSFKKINEINERLLEQHRQKNMNAWRLFCSRQTCQNNASSINQLERNVHVVNVGTARTTDWQQVLYFFSSPRLALGTTFALRAKCCVRLAWLIKRLLCRLDFGITGFLYPLWKFIRRRCLAEIWFQN